ncbi:MAG: hypothetical protein JO149_02095 [Gammaproteobacteria bacterium]|nr:hypothetical protein [Gammaproteobacteria bacterium]
MNLIQYQQQKGQGLIETLIVILFIAISITAFLRFQTYLSYNTNLSQQQSDATLLAVNQIETVRNYVVLTTTTGFSAYQDIASGSKSTTLGSTTYTIAWTVTTSTSPAYKTIDTTVSWRDRYGSAQSIRLVTRVASLDPGSPASFM